MTDIAKLKKKEQINKFKGEFMNIEQQLKEKGRPVIILFEGMNFSGKGEMISEFIKNLDPRVFKVAVTDSPDSEEKKYPFLHRFWKIIPEKSKFLIMDNSWYSQNVINYVNRKFTKQQFLDLTDEINIFERQLYDDGYIIIKIFLNVSFEVQGERIEKCKSADWCVTDREIRNHKNYDKLNKAYNKIIDKTDTSYAPWNIIDSYDMKSAYAEMYRIAAETIDAEINSPEKEEVPENNDFTIRRTPSLSEIILDGKITEPETYSEELKKQQKILSGLQKKCIKKGVPVIICYEGWDAAGKGGNIRRVTAALDPRNYEVVPVAAPDRSELARHYLWRFWKNIGCAGRMTIFDRTWYGRVMVEQIENLTPLYRCNQAYREINEFEYTLNKWGAVIIKFWLHIDKDEQLRRFEQRQNTPTKQWKITDEDWRNRKKWDAYETAVNKMISETSTDFAPWYVIEGNDKHYARLKTLKIINECIKTRLEKMQ